jgi:hypothetical protein
VPGVRDGDPTAISAGSGIRIRDYLTQLPRLTRLVRDLARIDAADGAAADPGDRAYIAAIDRAAHLLTLGRMAAVLARYRAARGTPAAASAPDRLVRLRFDEAGGNDRLDQATRAALDARPDDGDARYLRRLGVAQIAACGGAPPQPAPPDGTAVRLAAAWRQRAADAAADGAVADARHCLDVLTEIDVDSHRGRRACADLLRRHDPEAAARYCADLLDGSPKLPYGVLVEVYRGFILAFDERRGPCVAHPAFLGPPRLRQLDPLLRRRNRLLGLLAMRVHVARRLPGDAADPMADGPIASAPAPLTSRRGVLAFVIEGLHGWLAARPDLLRFMLRANSQAALRQRIDHAYRIWLMPTAAAPARAADLTLPR